MVAITPAFVLASLAATAFAGRDRPLRLRHEKAARSLHARNSAFTLVQNYTGSDFLDTSKWSYFTGTDPTNGMVNYLSLKEAKAAGLVKVGSNNQTTISVESGNLPSGQNRKSVRISANEKWGKGLIIADFAQMPYGCGVWPAFWTVGANWPDDGEIDIIEGVNKMANNQLTLHTGSSGTSCTTDTNPGLINGVPAFLGNVLGTTCASSDGNNAGCSFSDPDPTSFGPGFNSVGGRVITVVRDDMGIRMWSWRRSDVPADILAGKPNPDLWSSATAYWSSVTCNFDEHFADQTIVLNTDVAGGWTTSNLPGSGCGTDVNSIVANGSNFENGSWVVNSISVWSL
ncbi:concanavalin A-like lectin/glucanase domain-containing protein [Vararia minispora EC-137]|uniref:Concanavalin A-like lectin/glucanase domain-containing protein n=1 Tax=Vararia minispora EC-137 TaxID=1314806 RepID=A0ACB8QR66_9AGAM|nr:concanavalin A-like lectin/glucanase domain-containing protein [Vararia minispora EC-137]